MSNRVLKIVFFVLLAIFGVLYFFYDKGLHKNDIEIFEAPISATDSEDFQEFLYENHGKFVKLLVTLSPEMVQDILKGMDEDARIIFKAIDGENRDKMINYMIRLPDSGRRDFEFDKVSGKLSGYFKTYRRISPVDGSPIINLVPIPAKLLKITQ
jgi:hypothetical protein